MANRYETIVAGVVNDTADQIERLLHETPDAHWTCKDGKLIAVVGEEEYEMTFEKDDPLTEALLLLLNHRSLVLSHLRSNNNETRR